MILIFLICSTLEFKVARIDIEGNQTLSDKAIRAVMLTRTPNLINRGTFLPEIFKGDIAAIGKLYDYNGFLEARIDYHLAFDSTKKTVTVGIQVEEGNRTYVGSVEFVGNRVLDDEFLMTMVTTKQHAPLDRRRIENDNYTIVSLYDDRGYAEVRIESDYSIRNGQADIVHRISEGEKQFIESIEIVGLEHTREDVVLAAISVRENEILRSANILKSQRSLYNLGVFKSIRVQTRPGSQPNHKIIQFLLTEKVPIKMNLRIGYGTQDYLRLGLGLSHLNLAGRAWQGKVENKISFAEYNLNAQVIFPRFMLIPVKTTTGAFYQYKKEVTFRTRTVGGYLIMNYNLLAGKLSTKYDLENVRTYYQDENRTARDWLHGITVSWLKDRRDDPLTPRTGTYTNISLETSGIIIPADVNYLRSTSAFRWFRPILILVSATSIRLGVVREIAPSTEVPVYKRFYCGGPSSVRGYGQWSIGPRDEDGDPVGGRFLAELNQEIRFPIYRFLGGAIFIDGGNVWAEPDDFDGHLRWAIGAGLRVMTPLGSFRLDYGIKLGRRVDEPIGAIHFAVGEAF